MLLSCWPIARSQGGLIAVSTITERNQSIDMLSRMSALPLRDACGEIPVYYDPVYSCRIHLAELSSRRLSPEYEDPAAELGKLLCYARVFAGDAEAEGECRQAEVRLSMPQ